MVVPYALITPLVRGDHGSVGEASMLLVPKQLRRTGMTGNVPYYGGRFTPAQAYAAGHPSKYVRRPVAGSRSGSADQTLGALQHLLDTGVITRTEYEELRTRVVA